MAGVFGVEQCKKIAVYVAELMNIISKMMNGGGIFALFGAIGILNTLKSVDFTALKQEVGELDAADRLDVEAAFKSTLSLNSVLAQAKIVAGVGELEKAIDLVNRALALVTDAKVLVGEVRTLLGV